MCGILGLYAFRNFENKKKVFDIVVSLLKENEARGKDASGIALINTANDNFIILKAGITASEFVRKKQLREIILNNDYNIVLAHARAGTHGSATDNRNNHPLFSKEHNNCVIHNGIINNYEILKQKFNKVEGECDSEIILSIFNATKDIKQTIKKVSGSCTFALYSKRKLYLYRNSNPLYLAYNKTDDYFIFSSIKDSIKNLFKRKSLFAKLFELYEKEIIFADTDNEDLITINFLTQTFKKESNIENKPYTFFSTSITEYKDENTNTWKIKSKKNNKQTNLLETQDAQDDWINEAPINRLPEDNIDEFADAQSERTYSRFFNNHNYKNHKGGFRK